MSTRARGSRTAAPLYVITYACMPSAAVEVESVDPLGPRVRALREAMGLSLRDLALRSGVSAPMLSQVERGETSPTLQLAARIATGLELRLSQLLRLDEDGAVSVVRRAERRQGPTHPTHPTGPTHPTHLTHSTHLIPPTHPTHPETGGHHFEILTPPLPGQRAELSRHTLAPGALTGGPGDPPMHEPGSRETALIESGAVVLVCDGRRHELHEGDTVTFDADLPHHFENPGADEAVLLAVLSAGLRRS